MPLTAYSKSFEAELDIDQLVALYSHRDGMAAPLPVDEIPTAWRDQVRTDIECSSCFIAGAEIVREGRAKGTGKPVRQACFRFASVGHHPYCDFAEDDSASFVPENRVALGDEKSAATKAVRALTCAGIELGLFGQKSIRDMREWFFAKKVSSRFQVTLDPRMPGWLNDIRHACYLPMHGLPPGVEMSKEIASVPGFNWKEEARRLLEVRHHDLLEASRQARVLYSSSVDRVEALAKKYLGQDVFDPTILQSEYGKSIELAEFVAQNYLPINARAKSRSELPSKSLLALSALLLFVRGWDINAATGAFAEMAHRAGMADQALGNVVGLNPFHDFDAWRSLKWLQDANLPTPEFFRARDELDAIEADLRLRFEIR